MPAFYGLRAILMAGNRSAFALVDSRAPRRRQAVPAARGAVTRAIRGMVRRAGFYRGRDRDTAGFARQRDPSACAAHRTCRGRRPARSRRYLRTSPEFACKKLLAAGEAKIFEFARVFRDRERGDLHLPEFTMLEWYRADATYDAVMADTRRRHCPGRAGDRHRAIFVSRQNRRSVCRAGAADGGGRL